MKRFTAAAVSVLLAASLACGQAAGGWLRGEWEGTGFQTDSGEKWPMRLVARGGRYEVEFASLECAGRWRLLRLTSARAVFRETITKGAERCSQGGRVVLQRLGPRQLGYWYSHRGGRVFVASAILNRRR